MIKMLTSKPDNFKQIDKYLSRSAQPMEENLKWLKDQGVTDIINFRNMSKFDFDEAEYVQKLGMNYHSMPSVTKFIKKENVEEFLNILEKVKSKNGKVSIHCDHGADRTGMFSYIYERLNNIGTQKDNLEELTKHRWHKEKYPNLVQWAEDIIDTFKKDKVN